MTDRTSTAGDGSHITGPNGDPGAGPGRDPGSGTLFDDVRAACADVAERATAVAIDLGAIEKLVATLDTEVPPLLPEEQPTGDDEAVATEVIVWNTVNFGSGWFPVLAKRDGLSGARTLAESLADHVAGAGRPTARWLAEVDVDTCAEVFGQEHPGPVDDLLELFAQAWRDLGDLLLDRFDGSAAELVRAAEGSAERFVTTFASMPLADDVACYRVRGTDIDVPFHKRAQITVSHLARACGGQGLGAFDDAGQLTAFADNLVPHVLRTAGVLVYDDELADRIDRGDLLEPGGTYEVEIRACGLHAVELLALRSGLAPTAIDHQLWQRGQDPEIKATPRHRCRCSWY